LRVYPHGRALSLIGPVLARRGFTRALGVAPLGPPGLAACVRFLMMAVAPPKACDNPRAGLNG
jgi:hypothetical protein